MIAPRSAMEHHRQEEVSIVCTGAEVVRKLKHPCINSRRISSNASRHRLTNSFAGLTSNPTTSYYFHHRPPHLIPKVKGRCSTVPIIHTLRSRKGKLPPSLSHLGSDIRHLFLFIDAKVLLQDVDALFVNVIVGVVLKLLDFGESLGFGDVG